MMIRKKTELKQSENEATRQVIDYLELKKYRVFKIYNGAIAQRVVSGKIIYKKKDQKMSGVPDLIALREGYPILFIEMKGTGGRASDNQKEFLRLVNEANGAKGLVAWGIDEVVNVLETREVYK